MTQEIIDLIDAERARQDEKHPALPRFILGPHDPTQAQFNVSAELQKEVNDRFEGYGAHSWYGIMNEESAEMFTAETIEELERELVQSIALGVRLLEEIRAGRIGL